MSKLAFRAQTVDIAYLPLHQGFFDKKRFNDRSKGFLFGQQPVKTRARLLIKMADPVPHENIEKLIGALWGSV